MKQGFKQTALVLTGFICSYLILSFLTVLLSRSPNNYSLQLPLPIASEPVVVAACGQSLDAYLIQDLMTELRLEHYFIPQAVATDLDGVNTLIVALGHSPLGLRMIGQSLENEIRRTQELLAEAASNDIVIIAVYLGGSSSEDQGNLAIIEAVTPYVDRFIIFEDNNEQDFQFFGHNDTVSIRNIRDLKPVIISSLR